MKSNYVYIYDSTLRDGAQTRGVDFNLSDKKAITRYLDKLGVDYIEGGWPGANPTDDAYYKELLETKKSRISAFGMTRRASTSADNDPGLNGLINSGAKIITMVGKTWDFHVYEALNISLDENIDMIKSSIEYVKTKVDEVMFDAEHFFDGYKANPEFAINCVQAAYDAGARWIVLCDTNGGMLPHEISEIVEEVTQYIPGNYLGIHCHDDTGNAVANSLAAIRAGVRQVQGTLNGLGERCGNANLVTLIPNLMLKTDYELGITQEDLAELTYIARMVDERLGRSFNAAAPYVGNRAFAHKGGLHVSAVAKAPKAYEHVPPEAIGNERAILVSNQAGRSNILSRLKEVGIKINDKDKRVQELVDIVKEREFEGYAYDSAEASFELLAKYHLGLMKDYFSTLHFRVIDERRWSNSGQLVTMSEAVVKMEIQGQQFMQVAEGTGPVGALDKAMRQVLQNVWPSLSDVRLIDYKVRILTPQAATNAVTRVFVETEDKEGQRWQTIGVSSNIIDASYAALRDAMIYFLYHLDGEE
ncbi:MAG: citramalate synthase [Alphaproteobacteria bacterium]